MYASSHLADKGTQKRETENGANQAVGENEALRRHAADEADRGEQPADAAKRPHESLPPFRFGFMPREREQKTQPEQACLPSRISRNSLWLGIISNAVRISRR